MENTEFETIFKRKEITDIVNNGDVVPLDDIYAIEDIALTIKDMQKKIDFYEDYKKKRKSDIENEILVLNNKINFFKDIISVTLKKNKEKSLKFPGSCAVQTRNQNPSWKIDDEEEFIKIVRRAEENGEKVDGIIKTTTTYGVNKKEAYKLLEDWEKSGKLEEYLDIINQEIVHKEAQKSIVVLKFEENEEKDSIEDFDITVVKKSEFYSDQFEDIL